MPEGESMSSKQTIEIGGIRYEVVLDEATRIESFKIGDTVKVLEKQYTDSYVSKYGVIIGFDDFKDFPNIQVAVLDQTYSSATIKIVDINPSSEKDNKYRVCKVIDANLLIDKTEILRLMDYEIEKKNNEIKDLQMKKKYFIERFEAYFKQ